MTSAKVPNFEALASINPMTQKAEIVLAIANLMGFILLVFVIVKFRITKEERIEYESRIVPPRPEAPIQAKEFIMKIDSPLVSGAHAIPVKRISSRDLIEGYQRQIQYDVSEYFANIPAVDIYECERTGYRFYFPFSLVGGEDLYRHLQTFDWNYKPDKWEYRRAASIINMAANVLDVGCGEGAFLSIARDNGLEARGVEMNSNAAEVGRKNGLNIYVEMIAEHADKHTEAYDAVCSFQVLEHIPNVHRFISDCVRSLKPGGTLIFGVPNNDAFLKYSDTVLNAPPHHMGLWTRKSLTALTDIFPLRLKQIETEPLAEIDWYVSVMERKYLTNRWLRAAYYKSGISCLAKKFVTSRATKTPGHTILAVYEKLRSNDR